MLENDNTTHSQLHATERSLLALYNIIVVLTLLIGDSLILVSTVKYNAIKLHKVIATVIQHLAVSDILVTIFKVTPQTISVVADSWILKTVLCHAQYNSSVIFSGATMILTCCMTTSKLLIVKYPLRAGSWSTRQGHRMCSIVWALLLLFFLPLLVTNTVSGADNIYFSRVLYQCDYDYASSETPAWQKWYSVLVLGFVTVITHAVLFVTSLLLLITAKRAASLQSETVRWQGTVTVLLTVTVYFISWLPWFIVYPTRHLQDSPRPVRAAYFLQNLNIMANIFVYTLTLKSFRQFLVSRFALLSRSSTPARPRGRQNNPVKERPQQNARRDRSTPV